MQDESNKYTSETPQFIEDYELEELLKTRSSEEKYFYFCFFKGVRNLNFIISVFPTLFLSWDLFQLLESIYDYFYLSLSSPQLVLPPLDYYILSRFPADLFEHLAILILSSIPILTVTLFNKKEMLRDIDFINNIRKHANEISPSDSIKLENANMNRVLTLIAKLGETYLYLDDGFYSLVSKVNNSSSSE